MVKWVGVLLLAVAVFLAGALLPLAIRGDLSFGALARIFSNSAQPTAVPNAPDPAAPLVRALREQKETLDAKQRELEEWETRLSLHELQVDEDLANLHEVERRVTAVMDQLDAERHDRLQVLADTLTAMKPAEAAADLEAMAPEDAAELLVLMDARRAGRIMDAIESDRRPPINDVMKARGY